MIRDAKVVGILDIDAYQGLQAKVFFEAKAQGAQWIVSDFVPMGTALIHAEFLMSEIQNDPRARQRDRLLPTCPPALEYDGVTKMQHFSYSGRRDRNLGDLRTPHHAELLAYTRWTNFYSMEEAIPTGDLISDPV
ncbi:hypothetical protein PhaeoP23_03740 (plasmid) [Phaeobacter piscinae]|uniref:Uncharacterized protein n=1 Tax=Phaeobacter piscinae TaxID=1580596 RepID=A0ABN5DK56_9RHOB|nr:hypothetical protein [Phaeobacter piscinae]ATG37817.1 hypothetical protein PhaeoP36_03740 [Phaeobacter piscinae]AUQ88338.1 hypothetical protein PhaeoP42_03741 [Phaeobacter piscinae]AUR26221.1 hypothetical protein PhaeoP23_03740 [Phaeobacter piscinae]